MIHTQTRPGIAVAVLAALTSLTASSARAEPFTYQGQLQDAGTPASGIYDFRFQLFNAPVGGAQIGPTLTFNDVLVTDGVFTVDPDFGDVFNQNDAFIFIEVREGTSAGGYTGLLPRTPVTATPKAQHATTADTVLDTQWTEAPGILFYGNGTDRVFINRENGIVAGEFFGVHGDTTGFAGMYVSGPVGSLPFYAYSIDGGINAYTYVDAANNWNLNIDNSFIGLQVDIDGNSSFAGDIQAGGKIIQSYAPGTTDLATPIAYGYINFNGTVANGTPNISAVWNAASSRYEIEISDEAYFFSSYVTVVTPTSVNVIARTSSAGGRLIVDFRSTTTQTLVQSNFQFVTFKPDGAAAITGLQRPTLQPLNTPFTDAELNPNPIYPQPRTPIEPKPAPQSAARHD